MKHVNEAIKHLKSLGWIAGVDKIPNRGPKEKRWLVRRNGGNYQTNNEKLKKYDEYTDRELVAFARVFSSERSTPWNKHMKNVTNRGIRQRTRDKLSQNKYDNVPTKRYEIDSDWSYE